MNQDMVTVSFMHKCFINRLRIYVIKGLREVGEGKKRTFSIFFSFEVMLSLIYGHDYFIVYLCLLGGWRKCVCK